MTPEEYCRDKAAPPGSNLYYSLLYQTSSDKRAIHALFAFDNELHQTLIANTDPGVARLKLQWWREEIERTFAHQSRHPVGIEIDHLRKQHVLDKQVFESCIDATELILGGAPLKNYDTWLAVLGDGTSRLWNSAVYACHCKDPDLGAITAYAGRLFTALDILQNTARFIHQGLCPLPQWEMEQHDVTMIILQGDTEHPSITNFFATLLTRLKSDLEDSYNQLLKHNEAQTLFCLIAIRIAIVLCEEIAADNYRLMQTRLKLTPIRKLWIAWRTKRKSGLTPTGKT